MASNAVPHGTTHINTKKDWDSAVRILIQPIKLFKFIKTKYTILLRVIFILHNYHLPPNLNNHCDDYPCIAYNAVAISL